MIILLNHNAERAPPESPDLVAKPALDFLLYLRLDSRGRA